MHNVCGLSAPENQQQLFKQLLVTKFGLRGIKIGTSNTLKGDAISAIETASRNTEITNYGIGKVENMLFKNGTIETSRPVSIMDDKSSYISSNNQEGSPRLPNLKGDIKIIKK